VGANLRDASWEDAVRWLISQPDQAQLVRECYYDLPAQSAAIRYACSEEWQEIERIFGERSGQALDLGAGNGISSVALAKAGWEVTAVEPDPSDLVGCGAIEQLARALRLPITVVQDSGESLRFADESYDLVFGRQVMHHARDLRKFCGEVGRVLRRTGLFVSVRDHVISNRKQLGRFLQAHPLHSLYGGENAFTLKEYSDAFRDAGLKIVRQVGPFDSAINFAPQTRETLRQELVARASRAPGGGVVAHWILRSERRFDRCLRLLSRLDRRPGRLFSFVCVRAN
jgi:SAM-dependent methyltransferase